MGNQHRLGVTLQNCVKPKSVGDPSFHSLWYPILRHALNGPFVRDRQEHDVWMIHSSEIFLIGGTRRSIAASCAGVHKRLSLLAIEIRAVHEGVVNTVLVGLVGLRGLVGQLYREDSAHKVRRGQAGRVSEGLAGGGLTYGYAAVPGKNGERVIVNPEAEVVRRIFQDYVDGRTPREIAHDLNKERALPPARSCMECLNDQRQPAKVCRYSAKRALCRAPRVEQGQNGEGSGHWEAPVAAKLDERLADR